MFPENPFLICSLPRYRVYRCSRKRGEVGFVTVKGGRECII